jgi:hypothetical protein
VTGLDEHLVEVDLVNLDFTQGHELAIFGGLFAEHELTAVEHDVLSEAGYPGSPDYGGGPIASPATHFARRDLGSRMLNVRLHAGSRVRLRLEMRRFARQPSVANGIAGATLA